MIGTLLDGKYLVKRQIGSGAMGAVYEAEHAATGRRVAVKVISASEMTRDQMMACSLPIWRYASARRRALVCRRPTRPMSFTATSSRPTCSSPSATRARASSSCSTSASPR
jgi:serine/threonine protein kinase